MRTSILTLAIILCFGKSPVAGFIYQTLDFPGALNTAPLGIENGVVVGYYWNTNSILSHGFIYDGTNFVTIDYPGAIGTVATDVSSGRLVGYYFDSSARRHGFIYEAGGFTTLDDPLTSNNVNYAANGTGASGLSGNNIVGDYIDDNGHTH